MESHKTWEPALHPEDLARFFTQRANAGEADGLAALYAADAVLVAPGGEVVRGTEAIRDFYARLLAGKPVFQPGDQRPPVRHDDIALTSSRLVNGAVTAEVARRQPDGTWLWIIDQPAIAKETA